MNETQNNGLRRHSRQVQRHILITLATLVTLVAIFYLEEDWRGKHAWETFKNETEAKGLVLDWEKHIPPPVPDGQNFFTASTNIMLRFKKPQTDAETKMSAQDPWLNINYWTNSFPVFDNTKSNPLVVALINILPTATAVTNSNADGLVLTYRDPDTPERIRGLIQKNTGRSAYGMAGFKFSELQLSNLAPAQIVLRTDAPLSAADMTNLVPKDLDPNLGQFQIQTGKTTNTFQVLLVGVRVTTAADFLKWSDKFVPALDEVREALKRPYALLPGDYSQPYLIPVPNFIELRSIAQMLSQRAQCYFLLNEPDKALRELTLEHDACRILRRIPAGKPITLVESMVNVAITGLYASTVADGLRLHAWKDPQLAALQQQFKQDDLLSLVMDSLAGENASASFNMLNPSPGLTKALWGGNSLWQRLKDPSYLFLNYAPRGWLYQNAVDHVTRMQNAMQCCDVSNQLIFPKSMDAWLKPQPVNRWNPYSFLEAFYLPNLSRALQQTVYNQTWANETRVACALERYHLARGEYPETLDTLVPQFIAEPPHDVIGGQPLHYRRTNDGKFLLYSIGWNGTDDGGVPGSMADVTKGDWVWQYPIK